jgi:hypothetical protein
MRRVLITALAAAASIAIASPASAAVLVADGITYNLTLNSITSGGLTGNFTLAISGINTASDTEGGRTGINAIAFNDPSVGNATGGTFSGWAFQTGGLNAAGCDGSGNFFCFDNSSIPPTPSTLLGSSLSLNFSVTSNNAGSWTNYINPDFKIDWVGSQNNYDLVSKNIPVNRTDVPEPATWAMMLLGFGGIGMAMRRRRNSDGRLLQIA